MLKQLGRAAETTMSRLCDGKPDLAASVFRGSWIVALALVALALGGPPVPAEEAVVEVSSIEGVTSLDGYWRFSIEDLPEA